MHFCARTTKTIRCAAWHVWGSPPNPTVIGEKTLLARAQTQGRRLVLPVNFIPEPHRQSRLRKNNAMFRVSPRGSGARDRGTVAGMSRRLDGGASKRTCSQWILLLCSLGKHHNLLHERERAGRSACFTLRFLKSSGPKYCTPHENATLRSAPFSASTNNPCSHFSCRFRTHLSFPGLIQDVDSGKSAFSGVWFVLALRGLTKLRLARYFLFYFDITSLIFLFFLFSMIDDFSSAQCGAETKKRSCVLVLCCSGLQTVHIG